MVVVVVKNIFYVVIAREVVVIVARARARARAGA